MGNDDHRASSRRHVVERRDELALFRLCPLGSLRLAGPRKASSAGCTCRPRNRRDPACGPSRPGRRSRKPCPRFRRKTPPNRARWFEPMRPTPGKRPRRREIRSSPSMQALTIKPSGTKSLSAPAVSDRTWPERAKAPPEGGPMGPPACLRRGCPRAELRGEARLCADLRGFEGKLGTRQITPAGRFAKSFRAGFSVAGRNYPPARLRRDAGPAMTRNDPADDAPKPRR